MSKKAQGAESLGSQPDESPSPGKRKLRFSILTLLAHAPQVSTAAMWSTVWCLCHFRDLPEITGPSTERGALCKTLPSYNPTKETFTFSRITLGWKPTTITTFTATWDMISMHHAAYKLSKRRNIYLKTTTSKVCNHACTSHLPAR